jgi:hypothetical protein
LAKASRWLGEILDGALQHRPHTHAVSCGVVMECNRDLNQSLKKFLVFGRCSAPNVFESFVSVEELAFVKQGDSLQILIGFHPYILA